MGAGGAVMYPKKRGCPLNSECVNNRFASVRAVTRVPFPTQAVGPRDSARREQRNGITCIHPERSIPAETHLRGG
jgi:hypothetical protein